MSTRKRKEYCSIPTCMNSLGTIEKKQHMFRLVQLFVLSVWNIEKNVSVFIFNFNFLIISE